MNGTDSTAYQPTPEEIGRLRALAEEMGILTEKLYETALLEDWNEFGRWLGERKSCIRSFDTVYSKFPAGFFTMDHNGNDKIAMHIDAFRGHLQKVAKVDAEVFDIISEKRARLRNDISNVNKGLRFLKSFSRQVNGKRIISKVY